MSIEKLIGLVRERPWLYDSTNRSYRDVIKTTNSWQSIAKEMDMEVNDCKKKWKNLRDHYTRQKAIRGASKSGSAANPTKKWKHMDAMDAFMNFHVKHRMAYSNIDEVYPYEESLPDVQPQHQISEEELAGDGIAQPYADSACSIQEGNGVEPEAMSVLRGTVILTTCDSSPSTSETVPKDAPGTSTGGNSSQTLFTPHSRKRKRTDDSTALNTAVTRLLDNDNEIMKSLHQSPQPINELALFGQMVGAGLENLEIPKRRKMTLIARLTAVIDDTVKQFLEECNDDQ